MEHFGDNIQEVPRGKAGDRSVIDKLLKLRSNQEFEKKKKLLPNLVHATGESVGYFNSFLLTYHPNKCKEINLEWLVNYEFASSQKPLLGLADDSVGKEMTSMTKAWGPHGERKQFQHVALWPSHVPLSHACSHMYTY